MMVAIIKYNAGNIRSVINALDRLGVESVVTDEPKVIKSADRVIFPGVGEASTAMEYLKKTELISTLKSLKQPFLGICLGMQLICNKSEENNCSCIDLIDTPVLKFDTTFGDKIPHVGWNTITNLKTDLFKDIDEASFTYFVHSYYVAKSEYTIATCNYCGVDYSAAINKDNYYAVQFHPEKSGKVGAKILSNFLKIGAK
ncbi:MAG: imidazole glycerol phosphate synthase subunit HisH [Spirochaetaceae bacterium]|nr:imidazole glycerol phosphate synthase subunit HisH [Spirochaetaceae bacterium]